MARLDRIGFELLSELLHIDAQVMGMLDMRGPPHLAQQLAVRDHHAEVLRQAGEKAEFQRREMDLHAVALYDVPFQVRRDLAQLECRLAGAGPGGIAQRHAHAREVRRNLRISGSSSTTRIVPRVSVMLPAAPAAPTRPAG